MNNLRLLGLKSFLISGLLFFSSVAFAQNYEEQLKELKQYKQKRSEAFLNEPYFFTGFGFGFMGEFPLFKIHTAPEGILFMEGVQKSLPFLSGRLFVGAHYKRHYFTIQFENLDAYSGVRAFKQIDNVWQGWSEFMKMGAAPVPYFSLMYQYDVLKNNRKIGLQPGIHAGVGLLGSINRHYFINQYFDGSIPSGANPDYRAELNIANTHKVGFGFGPSLNFEVNFGRSFSLNFYQQLSYIAGPVSTNEIWFQAKGEQQQYGMAKASLLNYSGNISFRFKMYFAKTRFKVADKLKGN